MHSPRRLRQKLARVVRGGGRGWQGEGVWMAKKRYARVGAASFPAGDLELVIKYKEPCFASSHPESARPLLPLLLPLLLLLLLLPPTLSLSLLVFLRPLSPCPEYRERAVFNSRLHSIYFESRITRRRTSSKRSAVCAIGKVHE